MSQYAPPVITATGLTTPSFNDIYNYYLEQFQLIYGTGVVTDPSSADIQQINILALAAADVMAALVMEYNNRAPNFAIGAALDSLVSLNGLVRKASTLSTVFVTLTGTSGAVVTNGVVVDDVFGYRWDLPISVTIGVAGTTVLATCETPGTVNVGPGTVIGIASPTAGWTGVTNASASVPGQPVEADSQLRTRQGISVELPSQTILAGTIAAIAAVSGVTRYAVDENTTGTTNGNGTPGHSIQAVVEGGTDADVAQAIFDNRGLGCGTSGSTTVAVTDPLTGLTMNISFDRPAYQSIFVSLNAHNQAGGSITAAQRLAIQNGLAAYLNGLQLAAVISYGELVYEAAAAVNTNPELPNVSIRAGLKFATTSTPTTDADIVLGFGVAAQVLAPATNILVTSV